MAFVQLAAIQGKSEAEIKGRHGQRYVGVPYHVRNPAWSTSAMPSGGSCTACGTRGSRTGPFPRKVPAVLYISPFAVGAIVAVVQGIIASLHGPEDGCPWAVWDDLPKGPLSTPYAVTGSSLGHAAPESRRSGSAPFCRDCYQNCGHDGRQRLTRMDSSGVSAQRTDRNGGS